MLGFVEREIFYAQRSATRGLVVLVAQRLSCAANRTASLAWFQCVDGIRRSTRMYGPLPFSAVAMAPINDPRPPFGSRGVSRFVILGSPFSSFRKSGPYCFPEEFSLLSFCSAVLLAPSRAV
ncbi:hypothetical protein MRX96_015959 [Rhipicephalus microplus]